MNKNFQEISRMSHWRNLALAVTVGLLSSAHALAQTAIKSITSQQQAGVEVVRIELTQALTEVPKGFTVQTPPRIAIDLPGVVNGIGRSMVEINQGNLRSANVAQAGERTRVVLNLRQASSYRAELQGSALVLALESAPAPSAKGSDEPVHFSQSLNAEAQSIRDIDFRRG